MSMSLEAFHESLVRDVFRGPVSDAEALAIMAVLHHYRIGVRPEVLSDTKERLLSAITQRDAAACVAALWAGTDDTNRASYAHWYWEWNTKGCAETPEGLPDWLTMRCCWAKSRIEAHPDVEKLELEDQ